MVSRLSVIGFGMGNPALLTVAARDALAESELVIGAPRLLEALADLPARKVPLVASQAIADELRAAPERVASVVMSGDVGFYSGATPLLDLLDDMDIEVEVIPGISSLSYLCARLGVPWQDVHVVSAHGRPHNVVGAVRTHRRTFVLTGGRTSAADICRQLAEGGLPDVTVQVGERLSYPDECITAGTAEELAEHTFSGLDAMLVTNTRPLELDVEAPHLTDAAFERGEVPMTKEEVRELALCKLRVRRADVVWDVGAGTGSISVEAARAAREGLVVAIERNPVAVSLLHRNRERFGLTNLRIVEGEAPDALEGMPAPDRVFVGGSGGRLGDILGSALAANPAVRICIAAITLETLSAALASVRELGLGDVDIVQLSVAKAREVGDLHMMMGQNPVYLVSAEGPGACESERGEAR